MVRDNDNYIKDELERTVQKVQRILTLDTLISEEALLLAKYLRNEKDWLPKIVDMEQIGQLASLSRNFD